MGLIINELVNAFLWGTVIFITVVSGLMSGIEIAKIMRRDK